MAHRSWDCANLVKGATGQSIDNEALGGARTHNEISGVAHYRVADDPTCLEKIREVISELPARPLPVGSLAEPVEPSLAIETLYDIIPENHRQPYDARQLLSCLLDGGHLDEFQADYAKEMITGHARIRGIQVGVIANNRGMIRVSGGGPPRFGGIIYTESAEKVSYFIDTCNRHQTPCSLSRMSRVLWLDQRPSILELSALARGLWRRWRLRWSRRLS